MFFPRYNHSVCVYDDRFLVITGGHTLNYGTKGEV